MKTFTDHVLTLGSDRIYYQSGGEGEPLVMLHGLSGSSLWWARNMQELSRHFRVYVVDLIGYGRSRGQRFVLHQTADLIARMLDELNLPRANLMGHSMGGYIAGELAAHHPQRVDRLVLVDAVAVPVGRSIARSAVGLAEELPFLPVDFLPVLLGDMLRAGPNTLMRTIFDIHRADLTANLNRIASRTLIVWGENDKLMPRARGDLLHSALPLAEYVVIPRAGHNPMWDQPEIFNRVVLEFLEK